LFAGPVRFPERIDPMDRFGLNAENLPSSKTRAVDSLNCELVGGWFRGPSFAVYMVDSFAYMGAGQSMKILNVKDSATPVLVGEILLPSTYILDIFVKDTIAYVTNYEDGLRVINVSDPSSPFEIGLCDTPGRAWGLWVEDTFAYITDVNSPDDDGLLIIDISDPSSPIMIGSYYDPRDANDVWVKDTIAYVAGSGLRIIDVSDPSTPTEIGFYDSLYSSRVYVHDTLAYVAGIGHNDSLSMSIINVVDPSSPVKVGSYSLNLDFIYDLYAIRDIWVKDSLAYIAVGSWTFEPDSCGLYIVNVADPTYIKEVGNYVTGGGRAEDICIKDNLAYVGFFASYYYDPEGLIIIDVSNPSLPSEIGEYDTYSWVRDIWVKDSFAYVANSGKGLNILNVSDPSSPHEVGFFSTSDRLGEVFVKDTFAYVADGDSGLRIINIASPSSPKEVGIYYTSEGGGEIIYVQDTLAYITAGDSGLCIINVSDPSFPKEVGFYDMPEAAYEAYDVWVQDTIAYLIYYIEDTLGGSSLLDIINVSDPSSPEEISVLPGEFWNLFIKDTLAYVTDDGLHILDISDPSLPVEAGFYNFTSWGADIWVKDDFAYVANCDSGLRIIDVSDPSSPGEVGFYSRGATGCACAVYVQDSLIYLYYHSDGLYILKYTGPHGGIKEISVENGGFNITGISGTIEINYSVVSNEEKIKIEIFNILGQKVACPVDGVQTRGSYTLNWSGKTGIYFIKMEMGEKVYRQKVLLLK
jgi:hypothetical protein